MMQAEFNNALKKELNVFLASDVSCTVAQPLRRCLVCHLADLVILNDLTAASNLGNQKQRQTKISAPVLAASIFGLRVGTPSYLSHVVNHLNSRVPGRASVDMRGQLPISIKFKSMITMFPCYINASANFK